MMNELIRKRASPATTTTIVTSEILCGQSTDRKVRHKDGQIQTYHILRQTNTYLRKNPMMLSILISSVGNSSKVGGKISLVLSEPSEY